MKSDCCGKRRVPVFKVPWLVLVSRGLENRSLGSLHVNEERESEICVFSSCRGLEGGLWSQFGPGFKFCPCVVPSPAPRLPSLLTSRTSALSLRGSSRRRGGAPVTALGPESAGGLTSGPLRSKVREREPRSPPSRPLCGRWGFHTGIGEHVFRRLGRETLFGGSALQHLTPPLRGQEPHGTCAGGADTARQTGGPWHTTSPSRRGL